MDERVTAIIRELLDTVGQNLVVDGDAAYIRDPVFGIVRNRVHAEVCKALLRTGDLQFVEPILRTLLQSQNGDGSWNEIHVNYNQPSALITSFVGEALLDAYRLYPHADALAKARDYVLAQELRPGYFLKSALYTADHLNVDASCGAFLARYAAAFEDAACRDAAMRAAANIVDHQWESGVYPYAVDRGTYPYTFNLPCVHYQAVTIYYLAKINDVLQDERVAESLSRAAAWLVDQQRRDGRFVWSKSGLMFAYYLSGAYGFAYASLRYLGRREQEFRVHADLSLQGLKPCLRGLVLRWEPGAWSGFPAAVSTAARTAGLGDFPAQHRAFRFGYGMYRQIARRRYADTVDSRTFDFLRGMLRIRTSTVEPSKNFPDLFMTSEVLDCLSQSLVWENGHETGIA
ncbi:terpene cyclase/mutase family protein [Methanoculleus sp. FWC-SCC1]|uniref:Terpene cyclase/mutase family protein n=1 Tax=Methanoculleus frigidifontis TaxID=2584085 RepID=A0ABT8MDQ6_9EURY|nr:prenyltransferase/squalene oxidase repeat-containing protein [Methanoculleus sp. FWC-SCC1]MDN7026083.1 terpene cyclase/mutase family protein [Methanoculleus sp. FWC-SCC1]